MIPSGEVQILLWFALLFYSAVMFGLLAGLRLLPRDHNATSPRVSVIVAARNEEQNIADLLDHLLRQDYPDFEIIVANDRSADRTGEIVHQYSSTHPEIHLVTIESLSADMPPKKHALAAAVGMSTGTILCFTDADCIPPPGWVSALVSCFDKETGLVAGFSPYSKPMHASNSSKGPGILHKFIEYEEFKAALWSAGSIGLNLGWLCTGRSLAYRRKVYDEVGGFEHIKGSVSGDDDLFLQLVRRTTRWRIRYTLDRSGFVPTSPPLNFDAFVSQRTRHFSAGKFFPLSMKLFFLLFHGSNLLLLMAFVYGAASGLPVALLLPFLLKCFVDGVAYSFSAKTFDQSKFAKSFLLMEVFYVLYNTLIGPLGFIKRFEWKPSES